MGMNCLRLLSELDAYVNGSKKAVFGDKRVVDYEEVLSIIKAIRESLPNDIKQAQYVLKNREDIMNESQAESAKIIQESKNDGDSIIKDSQREGREIINKAKAMADETIRLSNERGELIIKEALQEQAKLVDAHEITRLATEKAKETVEDAKKQAREMRLGARDYVNEMLYKLEVQLNKNLEEVKQNRSSI